MRALLQGENEGHHYFISDGNKKKCSLSFEVLDVVSPKATWNKKDKRHDMIEYSFKVRGR
jgi:hypothetical protein